jgi:uncharacterized RDD family membrane protein YckC
MRLGYMNMNNKKSLINNKTKIMEQYYIIENETKKGPFSLKELIELDLSETTLVWKKGLKDWTELKNLSEYKKNIPPPIPKKNIPNESVNAENKNIEENVISEDTAEIDLKTESTIQVSEISNHLNAGFGLRLVAFIIDFSFMFFLVSFFWAIFQLPIPLNSESIFSGSYFIFKNPLGILFGWLFYSGFESSRFQATPGKAILGLKVTNENFERIGFGQASGRFFGKILSGLIIGIGYIMIGFTQKRQGLHDQLAHTFVLKEKVNEIKRKPISWIVFTVSFLLFTASLFIPANTDLIENLDSLNVNNIPSSISGVNNLSFSYKGISFNYPDNWEIKKEEVQEDLAYRVDCSKKDFDASEIISIMWYNMKIEPKVVILGMIESLKEVPTHKNLKANPIVGTNYINYDAFKSEFNITILGETFYGSVISFNTNDKTMLILKQTDSVNKLKSEFKVVENSLKIE